MNAADVEQPFFCEHLRCTCAIRVCLERQLQRRKVANAGSLKHRFSPCGEGTCEQGMDNRLRFPAYRTKKRPVASWGHEGRGGR